jgi:hypothetical protein
MKKLLAMVMLITLVGCEPLLRPGGYGLDYLIGKNYDDVERKCPQCFDKRLMGTADGVVHLPDGRSFRLGEPNPSVLIYSETLTEISYSRFRYKKCPYIITVRKSDRVILGWQPSDDGSQYCGW